MTDNVKDIFSGEQYEDLFTQSYKAIINEIPNPSKYVMVAWDEDNSYIVGFFDSGVDLDLLPERAKIALQNEIDEYIENMDEQGYS